MSLNISKSLKDGASRTVLAQGISLALVFFGLNILSDSLASSLSFKHASYITGKTGFTLTIPGSDPVLMALYSFTALLGVSTTVISFKLFITNTGTQEIIEDIRNLDLLKTSVLLIAVGFFSTLVVSIGSLFLLIPGIYFAVAFIFFPAVVSTESKYLTSLKESWHLTKGNKLKLFGLLLILLLFTSGPSIGLTYLGFETTAGLVSGFEAVFGIAVISEAFKQVSQK